MALTRTVKILLLAEFAFALVFGNAGLLHRKDFDHAFMENYRHPSVAAQAELHHQQILNELCRLEISGLAFACLASVTIGGAFLRSRERNKSVGSGPKASA